jgi:nucleoside triphosphate pyrophosphatase
MMTMLGVPFIVQAAAIDETMRAAETPEGYLDRVTREKLEAVRGQIRLYAAAAVLVADTIVVSPGGTVLGKPVGENEAGAMIELLAGATHEVRTRFVLCPASPDAPAAHAQTVTTHVTFRALATGEARAYARTGEGRDKAGAYAVQGRAAAFIERIDGSYTGVAGLPLCEVVVALRALEWW